MIMFCASSMMHWPQWSNSPIKWMYDPAVQGLSNHDWRSVMALLSLVFSSWTKSTFEYGQRYSYTTCGIIDLFRTRLAFARLVSAFNNGCDQISLYCSNLAVTLDSLSKLYRWIKGSSTYSTMRRSYGLRALCSSKFDSQLLKINIIAKLII